MLEFLRATSEDLEEYMIAKLDAFADDLATYGFGPTGYDDYDKQLANIEKYQTYKIVLDGKIIGGLSCCNKGEYYWLGGLYIARNYQNQGIGAKAILFLESEFPDAKCWRLHTPYKSYRNHHFYEKMGYRKIGETKPLIDKGGFFLYEYEKKI